MTPQRAEVRARRILLLVTATLALSAVLAGLARLGFRLRVAAAVSNMHGPLLVLGVFTTLISLERAIALGSRVAYVAPLLSVLGGVGLVLFGPSASPVLLVAALALSVLNGAIVQRQAAAHTWLMLLGALGLVAANGAWAFGFAIPEVAPAWMAFFVATIAAERLELARLASPPKRAVWTLVVLCSLLLASSLGAIVDREWSPRVFGIALALIGAWLWRYDLARRTVRNAGLPRYSAAAVLLGASWLVVAGVLALFDFPLAGVRYDAILHAVFIGFVLSMVFAHAPIILPAVARTAIPFHAILYVPLAVLQLGLLARVTGDLAGIAYCRMLGGLANAAAILLFPPAVLWARSVERRKLDTLGMLVR
jgi:hypothetical protein